MRVVSWVVEATGRPMVRQHRDERPGQGEVLVGVAGCGVCHTDLGFFYDGVPTRHALPLTLGHEISGHVVVAGEGAEQWLGREVVVPAVLPCGDCAACRAGRGMICPAQVFPGNDVHGGFGTHVRVPARGLCAVPDLADPAVNPAGLDLSALAVIADAVSTPYQAVKNAGVQPGDLAVWVGAGGVGGFGVQISAALGAHVVAIDVDAARLERLSTHGAAHTLMASTDTRALKREIKTIAASHGVPSWRWRIFETSGQPAGQALAFSLLAHGSTLAVVGYTSRTVEVRLSNLMALEATAVGTWGCAPAWYPEVVALALGGHVALEPFIERQPMSTINDVFERLHHGGVPGRIVLVPGEDA